MNWILIVAFISSQNTTSFTAEFRTIEACQAAAREIQKQSAQKPSVVVCAAKQ